MNRSVALKLLDHDRLVVPLELFKKYPQNIINTSSFDCKDHTISLDTCFNLVEWQEVEKVLKGEILESQLTLEVYGKASLYGFVNPELSYIRSLRNSEDCELEKFINGDSKMLLLSNSDKKKYRIVLDELPGVISFATLMKSQPGIGIVTTLKAIVVKDGCLIYYSGHHSRSIELLDQLQNQCININRHKHQLLEAKEPKKENIVDNIRYRGAMNCYKTSIETFASRGCLPERPDEKDFESESRFLDALADYRDRKINFRKCKSRNQAKYFPNDLVLNDEDFDGGVKKFNDETIHNIFSSDNSTVLTSLGKLSNVIESFNYWHPVFVNDYQSYSDQLPERIIQFDFNPKTLIRDLLMSSEIMKTHIKDKHLSSDIVCGEIPGHGSGVELYTACHGYVRL